jgi:hypothetical protein
MSSVHIKKDDLWSNKYRDITRTGDCSDLYVGGHFEVWIDGELHILHDEASSKIPYLESEKTIKNDRSWRRERRRRRRTQKVAKKPKPNPKTFDKKNKVIFSNPRKQTQPQQKLISNTLPEFEKNGCKWEKI